MSSHKKTEVICVLCPYPFGTAPGQRFRYEQYLEYLKENGYAVEIFSFLNEKTNGRLYSKGNLLRKVCGVIKGFGQRKALVFLRLKRYNKVFIFREASPLGPPFLEWWIAKVAKKKIIYDFDDAIWLPNTSQENRIIAGLKWHKKVKSICKWAWKVSVGNEYLAEYAKQYNDNVEVIPTTIDMGYHVPSKESLRGMSEPIASSSQVAGTPRNDGKVVIGWTGTHSTAPYLKEVEEALKQLSIKYEYSFLVISNQEPEYRIKNIEYRIWNKETEIEDLNQIVIGVMPMPDNEWTRGKCGFKALQYMALGKPVVASPVGVNTDIIQDGVNGFLASTTEEWVEKLSLLIEDPELQERLGKSGRRTVEERYSVEANKEKYLQLFK